MSYNNQISEYIEKASEEQQATLRQIRALIHETVEQVEEEIKWGFPVFNNGKDFAYLRNTKKHITLGLYNIDKMKDPDNLLEGTGSTHKYVKIQKLDQKLEKQIEKWLLQITE
mgnify:CR=1 FL=1